MIYAVIDTNVLVSALLTHNVGVATAKVLDSVAKCDIVCVYNEDILMEYREVLHRPKFKFPERKIDSLLAFITQKGIHSDRVPYDGNMPDEKDRPFYEVSLSVEDSFLVTGNLKHFPVTPKVVTPSQMIDIINNQFINQSSLIPNRYPSASVGSLLYVRPPYAKPPHIGLRSYTR